MDIPVSRRTGKGNLLLAEVSEACSSLHAVQLPLAQSIETISGRVLGFLSAGINRTRKGDIVTVVLQLEK